MQQYVWVFLGGGLGAIARYQLGMWISGRFGTAFPWHTLAINVSGCFAIGVLLALLNQRPEVALAWRLFLVVGFLGGYTTFSTFSFEVIALLRASEWGRASWYVLASNLLGIGACFAGITLARKLPQMGDP
ncbi:MAG TPA: fluoride efflux transporter CrcB [Chloroflexota bacterium]|nr:fluoride efflux transporter CrcB [Chloroflexota bacterium]